MFVAAMSVASLANAGATTCLGGCPVDDDGSDGFTGSVGAVTNGYICYGTYDPVNNSNHKGKVITQFIKRSSSSPCASDVELKIEPARDFIKACEDSVIPDGYVVIEKASNYSGCGWPGLKNPNSTATGYGYKIKMAAKTSYPWQTICSQGHDVIPEDFVVMEVTRDTDCNAFNSLGIALKISYPTGANIPVCSGPIVPTGFGITSVTSSMPKCNSSGTGGSGPGKRIQKAQAGNTLCDGSTIPAGMAITATGNYSGCGYSVGLGSTSGPGFKIGNLNPRGSDVCASSPIPSDYVILRDNNNQAYCDNNKGHEIIRSDYLSSTSNWICANHIQDPNNPIPAGFIISAKDKAAHGCDGIEYNIRKPASHAVICDGSPVPDGWGLSQCGSSYSQCRYTSGASSYGCKLKTLSAGDSYCEGKNSVPNNMVITKKESSPLCSGYLVTVNYPSTSPGAKTTACNGSTIPGDFVITREKGVTSCGTYGGVQITKPSTSANTAMCAGGNIPAGFGIVSTSPSTAYCNGGYWNISKIRESGTYHLCGQTIPVGYVATELSDLCYGYVVTTSHNSPMTVCQVSEVPSGYVISEKGGSQLCGDEGYMIIENPGDGRTNVCADKSGEMHIPDNYVYTSVANPSYCNDSVGGYITPESSAPDSDILEEPDTTTDSVKPPSVECSAGTPNAGAFKNGASSNNGC